MLPAGILYMPAAEPSVTVERGADGEKIKKEADKQLRMSGLVLSDQEILRAMEAGAKGKFIPASLNQDGSLGRFSSALDADSLRLVMDYAKRLIATMGRELKRGCVEARPAMVNQNSCKFCPYGTVCGKEYDDKDVTRDKSSADQALERMESRIKREEKGGEENG